MQLFHEKVHLRDKGGIAMRKIRIVAVAIGMLAILLAFAMATAAIPSGSQQLQDKIDKSVARDISTISTTIPGEIFTGDYLSRCQR